MGIILFIAIPLLAMAIAWPLIWWQRTTVTSFVNRWIAENDLELLEFRERSFPGFSRFTFFNLGKQHLVLVDVKNRAGERRQCWLKLGGLISGLSGYKVECKWIEQG